MLREKFTTQLVLLLTLTVILTLALKLILTPSLLLTLTLTLTLTHTHTHTQPFNGLWSGTTRVGRYQKKHSPTHSHPGHWTSFINFLHLLHYIASFLFSLCAWQSSYWQPVSRSSLFQLVQFNSPFFCITRVQLIESTETDAWTWDMATGRHVRNNVFYAS